MVTSSRGVLICLSFLLVRLLLDEVAWEKPADGEKVQETLQKVSFVWAQDSCSVEWLLYVALRNAV